MKQVILTLLVSLLTQQITQAQGATYLSNLEQASAGSFAVGSNSWLATDFYTGNNAGGYRLDSVELRMADATGNPSGFAAMLYSVAPGGGAGLPGSSIGTLNGSLAPTPAGIYTYTPVSTLMLSPSATFFIVLTAGTTVADGSYEWRVMNTPSYNPSGGWLASVTLSSMNGSWWTPLPTYPLFDFSQFAINATPVPEPGVLSLFALGGMFFLCRHWRLC